MFFFPGKQEFFSSQTLRSVTTTPPTNAGGADVKKTGPKWEKQKKEKAEILPPFNLTLPSIFDNDAKPLHAPY